MKKQDLVKALRRCAKNKEESSCKYCKYCPASGGDCDCDQRILKEAADLLDNSEDPIAFEGVLCATASAPELRPCIVEEMKGLFHKWIERSEVVAPSPLVGGHSGGEVRWTAAIVEFEDGSVSEVMPHSIRFLDSNHKEEPRQ